jgi:hypothetical protein
MIRPVPVPVPVPLVWLSSPESRLLPSSLS